MKKQILVLLLIVSVIAGLMILNNKDDQNKTGNQTGSAVVDLSNRGLNEVSISIFDDDSVKTLDLSGNSLSGSLPSQLGKLKNLETLNASENNLTGVPAEIGQLSKLRVINFSGNQLTGLPFELGNLQNLEILDLRDNPDISLRDLEQIRSKLKNTNILTN